ncbi:hypothetical protein DFH11DRAFT_1227591 [Phellopilus nigrolimitatus]|nr:hypothetical protein DFH11DRAFT_1227591 [Phellopilus nigrolimitatus]
MVAQKTRGLKGRRYSYAERALNAAEDIRKRTRRNSIHLKTLKAQVIKNAEAQGDQLGPHWETWVTSTVKDLKSQGILQSVSAHGHVALTPDAKNRISQTQRIADLPNDHEHSPDCKENIGWKQLIRQYPRVESRNRRRSSARMRSMVDTGEDNSSVRKALSKMTKAELLVEVKKLQNAFNDLKFDRDTLEAAKSRQEEESELLLEKQARMIDKLGDAHILQNATDDDFGDITMVDEDDEDDNAFEKEIDIGLGDETMVNDSDDGSGIVELCEPHTLSGKSLDDHLTDAEPLLGPPIALGLTRTKSGSFISNISKQPTPAPSDSGSEPGTPGHIDDLTFFDTEPSLTDPDVTYVDGANNMISDNEFALGIHDTLALPGKSRSALQSHTPLSTPSPSGKMGDCSRNKVELVLKRRIEELVEERDEVRRECQEKLATLSASLMQRDVRIRSLEIQLTNRTDECKKLESSCTSLVRSKEDLCARLDQHDATEEEYRTFKDDSVELRRRIDDVEAQLTNVANELLGTQQLLRTKDKELKESLAIVKDNSSRAEDMRLDSERAKNEARSLIDQLTSLEDKLQESNTDRQVLQVRLDNALSETHFVKDELRGLIGLLGKEKTIVQEREASLLREIEDSRAQVALLQQKFRASSDQVEALRTGIQSKQVHLEKERQAKLRIEVELSIALTIHEEYAKSAERRLRALENDLSKSTDESERMKGEMELMRKGEQSLYASLQSTMEEVGKLSTQLEAKENELVGLRILSGTKDTKLVYLKNELETSHERSNVLDKSVAALQTRLNAVEVEIGRLHGELKEAEEMNDSLTEGYTKLKKVQMEEFEEMDRRLSKKRKRAISGDHPLLSEIAQPRPRLRDDDAAMIL